MRHARLIVSVLLLSFVLAGCPDDKPGGGGGGGGSSANPDELPVPQEVRDARDVVEKVLQAGQAGDAEAVRALCTSSMARTVGELEPRDFEYEIREAWRHGPSVKVECWIRQPGAIEDGPEEFIMTYFVKSTDDGWRVHEREVRVDWDDRGRI